jgi:4-hydroxybenzoate polyprenyltransferase
MRLYDEIKDYELDCEINPTRPLPRGLLSLTDVKKGIVTCIILEIITFIPLGLNAVLTLLGAILYSLLMYKEFFIPKLIRPHLTTYAVMHTVVTIPMGLSIFVAATGKTFNTLPSEFIYFIFSSWFVFNIFEFGRKTFTSEEERNAVESYSKIFTKFGAVLLVVVMSVLALYTLFKIHTSISIAQSLLTIILLIIGVIFSITDKEKFGKAYRLFSSIYIIFFYILFIIETNLGLLL